MQILLTGFKDTSSEALVKSINRHDRLILENDKEKSVKQMEQALQKGKYRYIFSFGQRPLIKNKIHIEDNAVVNGETLETVFDIAKLKKVFEDCGITVKLSHNAGTSYCNNIYYYGIKMIVKNDLNTKMVFIHIPYMKNISDPVDFFYSIEKGIIKLLSEAV